MKSPRVTQVPLSRSYAFMYENLVIVTQHEVYLLLEKRDDDVAVLRFDRAQLKYGSPNDEARGSHPLAQYGLGFYGLFEVEHSPWIREQMMSNGVHPKHRDDMFDGLKHFIACFKDVMLEVTCRSFEERRLPVTEVNELIRQQLDNLSA